MAIVKQGLSKCYFCLNDDSPWIHARLAHVLECTRHWTSDMVDYERPVSFAEEFSSQDCPFPYLNDFLIILENVKNSNGELTKEMVMESANNFVIKQNRENGKRKIKK